MVFLFTFLAARFKNSEEEVRAASLANFDPGYIISDYQMTDYNSMSEAEIQAFLTSKNSCSNRDYNYYLQLSNKYAGSRSWHFKDGHFVCLSEELFGDGEVIGTGETAAHIIWQAAQDYKINPKVLIVLLQKESGLITDPIPNNRNYRSATGYGCPDTAPCSTEYYGFKNQVRKAAALFRTVMDGGWTNYPIGTNYIQYNPSASCEGSYVNVRNLATSALYRYTPYQPNAGALAAGYGTATCGAYGNRNFYLYFEDWFGGVTVETGWSQMTVSRVMEVKETTTKINPKDGTVYEDEAVNQGEKYYFDYKTEVNWNGKSVLCLRTIGDTLKNSNKCIIMDNLAETTEELYAVEPIEPKKFIILRDTYKYDLKTGEAKQIIRKADFPEVIFAAKVVYNGKTYYQTISNYETGFNYYVPEEDLMDKWLKMDVPRVMKIATAAMKINPVNETLYQNEAVNQGEKYYFDYKTEVNWNGKSVLCLRTIGDTLKNSNKCIIMDNLAETTEELYAVEPIEPKKFIILRDTYKYDLKTGEAKQIIRKADFPEVIFAAKVVYNGKTYYQTISNYETGFNYYVPEEDLSLISESFVDFIAPRNLKTNSSVEFVDLETGKVCRTVESGYITKYSTKIVVGGLSYYRSEEDTNDRTTCALLSSKAEEINMWENTQGWNRGFEDFINPRLMVFRKNMYAIDMATGVSCSRRYSTGEKIKFATKTYIDGRGYFRTEEDAHNNLNCAIPSEYLGEI
ncbi:MAG: hypothetical protein Q4B29_01425 [Candidatus Saccharibacteria bacterium]|nr:hypothetical protein [Candidatus Saccharibacteria bacterium]